MAQQTDSDTILTPDDVIGHRIYNHATHIGLGVAIDVKTVRNGYGDTKRVFVCDHGDAASTRFINRDVDEILHGLENDDTSLDLHEIGSIFDDVTPDDYAL